MIKFFKRDVLMLLSNKTSSIFLLLLFSLSYLVMITLSSLNSIRKKGQLVGNSDNYIGNFKNFTNDSYGEIANGTTILYFYFIKAIDLFFKNTDYSFFLLNLISTLALVFLVYLTIKRFGSYKQTLPYLILSLFFIFQIFNMKSYLKASNDTFMGIFLALIIFLFYDMYKGNKENWKFLLSGILLGLTATIRPTFILALPFMLTMFFFILKNENFRFILVRVLGLVFLFLTTVLIFHYPSINEKNQLSFVDKNPKNGMNWAQRNYLGLSKIKEGKLPVHRDALWEETSFTEVKSYLEENGKDSLPRDIIEFIQKDPPLYLGLLIYNFLTSLYELFRSYSFLIFIPLIYMIDKKKFNFSLLFYFQILIVSSVCLTFIELRWLIGYHFLLLIGLIEILNQLKNSRKLYILLNLSILTIFFLNLRSIINIL